MRLLVLGGTAFLGQAVARHAVGAGHDVTCAARGRTGSVPDGARLLAIDRAADGGSTALDGERFDAVVDVARRPSFVRRAVADLADRVDHWVFVSSASVYADQRTPGQRSDRAALLEPLDPEADELDPEAYGPAKVACERLVLDGVGPSRSLICRAGLIVGPHDTLGRFDYWVERLGRPGEVLAPGSPDDAVQWIDGRDLAAWLVDAAEGRRSGVYDGIGPPVTRSELFAGIARGIGATPQLTWVTQELLTEQQVEPWFGPRSLPMWLPLPEYAGFLARDVSPTSAAGLTCRPLEETARDTGAWMATRVDPAPRPCGLTPQEEADVLAAWHQRTS